VQRGKQVEPVMLRSTRSSARVDMFWFR